MQFYTTIYFTSKYQELIKTKVVDKNVSQGCQKIRKPESTKAMQPLCQ